MTRALALCVALGVSGCAAPDAPTPTDPAPVAATAPMPTGPVVVALGEAADVAGQAVRFEAVVEDSRCPEGVDCFQAGRARIRVSVVGEDAVLSVPHERMGDGETATASLGGLAVTVEALRPYPGSAEAEAGAPVEAVLSIADAR